MYSIEDCKQDLKLVYVLLDNDKAGNFVFGDLVFKYEPKYIGQGNRSRPYESTKVGNRVLYNLSYKILEINLSKSEALSRETYYINLIGRLNKNTGPLLNIVSEDAESIKIQLEQGLHVSQLTYNNDRMRELAFNQLAAGTHVGQRPEHAKITRDSIKELLINGLHRHQSNDLIRFNWIRQVGNSVVLTSELCEQLGNKQITKFAYNLNKLVSQHNIKGFEIRRYEGWRKPYYVYKTDEFNPNFDINYHEAFKEY